MSDPDQSANDNPKDQPSGKTRWDGATPISCRYDDPYYSREDPLGEVRHTFIDGSRFSEQVAKGDVTVAETGFGTGLNFLESWRLFRKLRKPGACLTFLSVENAPLDVADLSRAHEPFRELGALTQELRASWPGQIPGVHRLSFCDGSVRLILLFGEAATMLARQEFRADIWYLDGFAPAKNPAMWTQELIAHVARLSRPGTTLASFTAAGTVRSRLQQAGFDIERRAGHGRKRHCIAGVMRTAPETSNRPPWVRRPEPISPGNNIAIVGDGIAARCLARSLKQAGFEPTRLSGAVSRAYAASTLPRALIAPKLVRGKEPFPRFWRQAFWDAVRELDRIPDIWVGPRGLVIPDERGRNRALVNELQWPTAHLSIAENGALNLPKAGSVNAPALLSHLCGPPDEDSDVAALNRKGGTWQLLDADGQVLATSECVVFACGPAAHGLMGIPSGLRIGSGQMLLGRPAVPSPTAILRNGYLTSAGDEGTVAMGATATGNAALAPVAISDDATEEILDRHRDLTGPVEGVVPWTGLRCDAGDHLPLAGPVQDARRFAEIHSGLRHGKTATANADTAYRPGLFALTGLGARGFQAAFLLADHLTSLLTGRPSPLEADISDALLPVRFQVREMKRSQ